MALPKLNDTPTYDMIIPSTGDKVTFRPFLVKEQKVLLMALESQDTKEILNSIINTINACVHENIKTNQLATFDLEYMFTQIRAKSVGETSDVLLVCGDCEAENKVTIDISSISVEVSNAQKDIKISDVYTIRLRYPRYDIALGNNENNTAAENMIKAVIGCLDQLMSEDEIILFDDESEDDIKAFVDNLTSPQLQSIMEFINDIPELKNDVKFDCEKCGKSNEITLKGIADFF